MPKISVIVPVYKVEKYLHECVDSILAQTFDDFELILVDDGSPDSCGGICDAYAAKDPRVRVIHQENRGLSGARNAGMEIARGEFLTFIDSDDLVHSQYLEVLLGAMGADTDISVCSFCVFEDGNAPAFEKRDEQSLRLYSGNPAVMALYNGEFPINACAKLFRNGILRDLRFPEGRIHEDQAFTPYACYRAGNIVSCEEKLYYYRENPESITRKVFSLKRYDDLWAIDGCIDFFRAHGEREIVAAALRKRQRLLCSYAIYARRDGVTVPEEYRVSLPKALWYLRRNTSADKFQYCLAQLNPGLVRLDAYARKLESIFRKK